MRRFAIAAVAAALLAGPAIAQPDPLFDDGMDERIARSIPPGAEIEAMAPVIDRMAGALLDVDVGPVIDAADPYARYDYRYRRGPRTLGDLAGRDDPAFERRLRASIYGSAAGLGRMMDAIAYAAPAMRRSLADMEGEMDRALREAPRRDDRYDYRRDRDDDYDPYED
jgi:hypothetical protein